MAILPLIFKYGLPIIARHLLSKRQPEAGISSGGAIQSFRWPTERAYTFGIPGIERIAQQRFLATLRGDYTPAQQAWFQRALEPTMESLVARGLLTTGGAPRILAETGAGLGYGMQQEAMKGIMDLAERQRAAQQLGTQLGLQRFLGEAGIEEQLYGTRMRQQTTREALEAEERQRRQERERTFWETLSKIIPAIIARGG